MRLTACVLLAVLLAACGTAAPTPTATPPPSPETEAAPTNEIGVLSLTIEVPQTGTLVRSGSNAPDGGRPAIVFSTVTLVRTGGIAGQTLTVIVRSDGTLTRDEAQGTVSEDTLEAINRQLNAIDFYSVQGVFTGEPQPDAYTYYLTVESQIGSRTITMQDGLTPPELTDLIRYFANLTPA